MCRNHRRHTAGTTNPDPPTTPPTPPAPTSEPCNCCDLCNARPVFGSVRRWVFVRGALPAPNAVSTFAAISTCAGSGAGATGDSRQLRHRSHRVGTLKTFLTGCARPPPMLQCSCCNGLAAFLSRARGAGPVARGQRLWCICPILHGDVNIALPKPVFLVIVMFLPIACGLALRPSPSTSVHRFRFMSSLFCPLSKLAADTTPHDKWMFTKFIFG